MLVTDLPAAPMEEKKQNGFGMKKAQTGEKEIGQGQTIVAEHNTQNGEQRRSHTSIVCNGV